MPKNSALADGGPSGTELGDQNPSADFWPIIGYKEGIMNICNHYIIIQNKFLSSGGTSTEADGAD